MADCCTRSSLGEWTDVADTNTNQLVIRALIRLATVLWFKAYQGLQLKAQIFTSSTVSFQQALQENGAVDHLLAANKVLTCKLHLEDFGKLSCAALAYGHAVSSQGQVPVFRREETTSPCHIRGIPKKPLVSSQRGGQLAISTDTFINSACARIQ